MTLEKLISRRAFLRWLLLVAVVPLLNRLRMLRWFGALDQRDPLVRTLTAVFRHSASAAAVGAAYLQQKPNEAHQRRLADLIVSADPILCRDITTARGEHVRRRLEQCHRADLANSRTVKIDGWIVSLTEARLCALVALSASRA